ncbi:MAG TPA: hypothetical protein VLL76_05900, partial [Candidatus Omnitrophota bacterium]|nr:hypothetical protein [Candidatus Omnitrophota bacterium]
EDVIMEWWTATLAVGALGGVAIALRSTGLSFFTLAAFMPLALYTLYNDFERFWILMTLAFMVEGAALLRYSRAPLAADPARAGGAAHAPERAVA